MLNSITIMGRLCDDPELRHTGGGTPVVTFTLAVDRDFKARDGSRDTDFIRCVAWRKTAEFVKSYFGKGQMAVVDGRLQIRTWNEDDGGLRSVSEVVVGSMYFGEAKREGGAGSASPAGRPVAVSPDYQNLSDDDGDLPF